jgi:hypothetical protein
MKAALEHEISEGLHNNNSSNPGENGGLKYYEDNQFGLYSYSVPSN